ncbi:unnamed protein product [Closterium sp. Yama58-4]|nr:unnamed protein product [Closterium sp. Yama58-4]
MVSTDDLLRAWYRPMIFNEHEGEIGEKNNGVTSPVSDRDKEVVRVPASISRHLMEHQKEGVRFLYGLFRQNTGGILADDMGLGKTIQAIALMAAVLGKTGTAEDMAAPAVTVTAAAAQATAVSAADEAVKAAGNASETGVGQGRSSAVGKTTAGGAAAGDRSAGGAAGRAILVVVPSSVLGNWQEELNRWGHFRISIFHGSHREAALVQLRSGWAEVVLTTFDTFRVVADTLCPHPWLMAIVDEVHRLRSYSSTLFQCADRINTARRYGLSGTVMQNEFRELWSVSQGVQRAWLRFGFLGTLKEFNKQYSDSLRLGPSHSLTSLSTQPHLQGQRKGAPQPLVARAQARQAELVRALARVLLRRHKDDLQGSLKLPGKRDMIVVCPMTQLQRRVYQRCLKLPDFQLLSRKDEPCSCGGPRKRSECHHKGDDGEKMGGGGVLWSSLHPDGLCCPRCPFCVLFPCLSKLQQISNHLELLKPNPRDTPDKQARDLAFARLALAGDADLAGGVRAASDLLTLGSSAHCGKLRALDRLLKQWCGSGDKVLLFSHSVKMLDVLQRFLEARGISFSRLDGSTSTATRQALVHSFNSSPSIQVFLISTKAGGIGLNLVSANRVIIFDPTWNPAHDLQAQDRSFRFGQTRHVSVYRLVAGGTVEEVVYLRQVYKQQQTNIAIEGASEERYFTGVQGSKTHQGELFGVANLFQDHSTSILSAEIIGKAARQPQQQQQWEKQREEQEREEFRKQEDQEECEAEKEVLAKKQQLEEVGKRDGKSAMLGRQQCDSEKGGDDLLVVQVPAGTPGFSPEVPGILSEGEVLRLARKEDELLVKAGRAKGRKDDEEDNGVSGLARFVEEREAPDELLDAGVAYTHVNDDVIRGHHGIRTVAPLAAVLSDDRPTTKTLLLSRLPPASVTPSTLSHSIKERDRAAGSVKRKRSGARTGGGGKSGVVDKGGGGGKRKGDAHNEQPKGSNSWKRSTEGGGEASAGRQPPRQLLKQRVEACQQKQHPVASTNVKAEVFARMAAWAGESSGEEFSKKILQMSSEERKQKLAEFKAWDAARSYQTK